MPAPRKDFSKAVEMYYLGASLEDIADAHAVSRQAIWKALTRREVLMRHSEPAPSIIWECEKYSLRENGYFAKTTGDRSYLHRDVWVKHNGSIPDGYEVHHKDEDKQNNFIENLQILTCSEHGAAHGFGGNQFISSLGRRPVK